MLEPDYLAGCADRIIKLYSQLEQEILKDIAKSIERVGMITDSTKHQLKMLEEAGLLYSKTTRRIADMGNISLVEIRELFEEAGIKSSRYDDKIYKAMGLNPIRVTQSQRCLQILIAGMEKTQKQLTNMTMTTAITSKNQLIDACNGAYMKMTTGTHTYQQAIRDAIIKVASEGISTIEYESGRTISLEACVRRNVLTGVNQTTASLSLMRMDDLGCNMVQTTSHAGARPSHQVWQGKVFQTKPNSDGSWTYPEFIKGTGYGSVTGLCGANCRHNFFPWFEGISRKGLDYSQFEAMQNSMVTFNGNTMSRYEGEQRLRSIERAIRQWKKREYALEAVGLEHSLESKKIREWQAKARDFCRQTGIPRDYMREKIYS